MILQQSLYHTIQRYRTLRSHRILALPIVILMPHSACNCRCVMCDIWKGNKNLKQLTEHDIRNLIDSLKRLGTKQVLMSGGEALLNNNFFALCRILKEIDVKITLLSTGIALEKNAENLVRWVDEIIISLDGPKEVHNRIRNIPIAFERLEKGINYLRKLQPQYRITARTVIHRLNFSVWPSIIDTAADLDLDQISFLPADVSSHAFNREIAWGGDRQDEILIGREELPQLEELTEWIINHYSRFFINHFIAESPDKLRKIVKHYKAMHGLENFHLRTCNAPWISAVIEADGSVRPCFFHDVQGNIHNEALESIVNSEGARKFRQGLNMEENEICKRCVCSLRLPAYTNPANLPT